MLDPTTIAIKSHPGPTLVYNSADQAPDGEVVSFRYGGPKSRWRA